MIPTPQELAAISEETYTERGCNLHLPGDIEALLTNDGDYGVLAFRGTELDYQDILRDMRGLPWYSSRLGAWCHRGFLAAAEGAWPRLERLVMAPGLSIHLTGHSLGGAICSIVGAFMVKAGKAPASLTTFGSPAPGYGGALGNLYDGVPMRRYVHGVDCVPDHPFLGVHLGPPTQIGAERSIARRWFRPDARFVDHRIANYRRALKAA